MFAERTRRLLVILVTMLLVAGTVCGANRVSAADGTPEAIAEQILSGSGATGGLFACVGDDSGRLAAAFASDSGRLVQVFATDVDEVRAARQIIAEQHDYGPIAVDQFDGQNLPLIDNVVNLLVVERAYDIAADEMLRVLCPQGVAMVRQGDSWRKLVKPRPETIDEWTHYLHDADNNAVAADSLVSAPVHMQWVAAPKWARHHNHLSSTSAMVSSGGRMFAILDEGPPASLAMPPDWKLVARDAFNGVLLWTKPIGPWEGILRPFRSGPLELARRLVAVDDHVYVTLGYGQPVVALDAASGEVVHSYDQTADAVELLWDEGVLYVVAGSIDAGAYAASRRAAQASPAPQNKRLLALDAETGGLLWEIVDEATAEILPSTLAIADGTAYFHNPTGLVAVRDGRIVWRAERPLESRRYAWSSPTVVVHNGVVLSADQGGVSGKEVAAAEAVQWKVSASPGNEIEQGQLVAYRAADGQELWRCPSANGYNSPPDVFVVDGLVWTGTVPSRTHEDFTEARDLKTGAVVRELATDPLFSVAHHHRCYRNKATEQFILLGRTGVELIDLADGDLIRNCWVRGACQYGVMPANGLLYAPPHSCACYIQSKLSGMWALASVGARDFEGRLAASGTDRLTVGPGAAATQADLAGRDAPSDWPTLRGDMQRSGRSKSAMSSDLASRWRVRLGGRLTSPVIAGGVVLVAAVDRHTIHALDADSGAARWSFTAGGRIDSPPSVAGNLAVFGSADGYLYCVRLSTGQQVWRLRAASLDQRTVAFDQLESLWPVTGTPLIRGESVYCTAGRSSFLDGGMSLLRVDLLSGKILGETRFDDRDPATGMQREETIFDVELPGALPDVLVDDGEYLYLRDKVLSYDGVEQDTHVSHLYSSAGLLDDHWWHRTSWLWGERNWGRASGWAIMPGIRPSGRILATNQATVFGFGRKNVKGNDLKGYHLFRADKAVEELDKEIKNNNVAVTALQKPAKVTYHWSREIPVLARGLAVSTNAIFAAGPDFDPGAAGVAEPTFDAASPASLMVFDAQDGSTLGRLRIEAQPVFDGVALADGNLYLSAVDGAVVCFGSP